MHSPTYLRFHSLFPLLIGACLLATKSSAVCAGDDDWVTIFCERQYVGVLGTKSLGGEGGTIRKIIEVPFEAKALRVHLRSERVEEVVLTKATLAREENGSIIGPVPILFSGQTGVTLAPMSNPALSDPIWHSIQPGSWFLQETLSSQKLGYSYDQGVVHYGPGDLHGEAVLPGEKSGTWPGQIFRVDALPVIPTQVIACFGDSITQGAGATKGSGAQYPELLGKRLGHPVLNLGVNGDLLTQRSRSGRFFEGLDGISTVIVLLGINDIIRGAINDLSDYVSAMKKLCADLEGLGLTVWLGTLPPAGGYEKFDGQDGAENLRQEINHWIRSGAGGPRVIDFDAAIRDPENPARIRHGWSDDRLHPNDAGYEAMALAAALALGEWSKKNIQ